MIGNQYKGLHGLYKKIPFAKNIFYALKKKSVIQSADYLYNNHALFSSVQIETINRCNGSCSFCPVNKNQPQRPYAKMTEELFKKIVDDLASIGYKDTLTLHCNNEPFLDDRIIEFAKYARGKLPNAYISIWTNGSLLTVEKVKNIMPYLNDLTIDNYNETLAAVNKTTNAAVSSAAGSMTRMTGVMTKSLSGIGISVGKDGRMSINELPVRYNYRNS